jgi:hypothetical protein
MEAFVGRGGDHDRHRESGGDGVAMSGPAAMVWHRDVDVVVAPRAMLWKHDVGKGEESRAGAGYGGRGQIAAPWVEVRGRAWRGARANLSDAPWVEVRGRAWRGARADLSDAGTRRERGRSAHAVCGGSDRGAACGGVCGIPGVV